MGGKARKGVLRKPLYLLLVTLFSRREGIEADGDVKIGG